MSCDADQDLDELIPVERLFPTLLEGIGAHDSLIKALHYGGFIHEILLQDAAFSSIIDEIFERKGWVSL